MDTILTTIMLIILGIMMLTVFIWGLGWFIITMREAYINLAHEWKKAWCKK